MTALAILDLGYGNTRSIALAFERLGVKPLLTDQPAAAASARAAASVNRSGGLGRALARPLLLGGRLQLPASRVDVAPARSPDRR